MAADEAKRRLTASKGWVTRYSDSLSELLLERTIDKGQLELLLGNLNSRLEKFRDAQSAYEMLVEEEDLNKILDEAATFEDSVNKIIVKATKRLNEFNDDEDKSSVNSISNVKLPKIELAHFSGSLLEWQSFWETFKVTVDQSDLPNVSKFAYLKGLLEGEAARVLDGLIVSSENYKVACELLMERFGQKDLVTFAHVQALMKLQTKNEGHKLNLSELRELQEKLNCHIRSLESLDVTADRYGVILTPMILSCLPYNIRLEWARQDRRQLSDEVFNLDFLMKFLKREIERQERSLAFSNAPKKENSNFGNFRKEKKKDIKNTTPTAASLQVQSSSSLCSFCSKDGHKSERCFSVNNLGYEERKEKIRENNLCFKCLFPGHIASKCTVVPVCPICNGKHNKLCCRKFVGKSSPLPNKLTPENDENETMVKVLENNTSNVTLVHDNKNVFFQLARVQVQGQDGKPIWTNIFFDSGSDHTYVTKNLVRKLSPEFLGTTYLSYAPFGGGKTQPEERNIFKFVAFGTKIVEIEAIEVSSICTPIQRSVISLTKFEQLKGLKLAFDYSSSDVCSVPIDVLVGMDYYWSFIGRRLIDLEHGLVAQDSLFGWLLSGGSKGNKNATAYQMLIVGDVGSGIESGLRSFWELESIGIKAEEGRPEEQYSFEPDFVDGRYEVGLPWKCKDSLMNNVLIAKARLDRLMNKLDKDPELKLRYHEVLRSMEEDGIIEEVSENYEAYPIFYLPHHPVVKESSSTTKIRPVFDASCRGPNGVSLNDCIDAGPSLLPDLVEVLIRFRRWTFALTADITKAFLQLKLKREDQDVHRFLWLDKGVLRHMRFKRVTFGISSSPFLLNATIKHHISLFPDSRVIAELKENLYVDDWLTGAETEQAIVEMFEEAQSVMGKAGMSLAKWSTSSKVISDTLGINAFESCSKILGIIWSPMSDSYSFEGISVPLDSCITKRVILSCIARLFDPLGFLTPFTISVKCLFQSIWKLGLAWDDPVPNEFQREFILWLNGMNDLKEFYIPRRYFEMSWSLALKEGIQLHAFSDASEKAYGAMIYLSLPGHGSSLVISKAKVAPIKKVTLPRLELLGCLLAVRLLCFVRNALHLDESVDYFLWTDSMIALSWIKGDPNNMKQFVANRVREIQSSTDPSHWNHCPGKLNPADGLTRGWSARSLVESEIWLKGPSWISEQETDKYEKETVSRESIQDSVTEEMKVSSCASVTKVEVMKPMFEFKRWGTLSKTIRIIGWVLRFLNNAQKGSEQTRNKADLSYKELDTAKVTLFRLVQAEFYSEELESLQRYEKVKKSSSIANLNPFLDEQGLIRVRSRLNLSRLSYEEKYPVIIPKCHVAVLIVRNQHFLLKHAGVDSVISSLRNAYWIVGVRYVAKRVKRQCVSCQRIDARACNEPVAPLPELRVTEAPPFSVTGLDYAGPVFCVEFPKKKFYILLFTCAVIRAVHLELVDSLGVNEFILAFKRFTSRRGVPSFVYSDNALTFRAFKEKLLASSLGPEWRFIAPRSPWWGGWWERLVGSVKSALKKTIGTGSLKQVELETVLVEVEACVNSRPLTFVGDEVDCVEPLCPNHFLIGRRPESQIENLSLDGILNRKCLILREQIRMRMVERFWKVWKEEYLRCLPVSVHKFYKRGDLSEGSVVLIGEDKVPRMRWDLGVVLELFMGKDGVARSARLHTKRGERIRPIHKLFDLELSCDPFLTTQIKEKKISNSPTQPQNKGTDNVVSKPSEPPSQVEKKTEIKVSSSGRAIKPRQILDL